MLQEYYKYMTKKKEEKEILINHGLKASKQANFEKLKCKNLA